MRKLKDQYKAACRFAANMNWLLAECYNHSSMHFSKPVRADADEIKVLLTDAEEQIRILKTLGSAMPERFGERSKKYPRRIKAEMSVLRRAVSI